MLTSQEATNARFFDLSLRSATSIEQVDAFMNRLIGTLQHYEQTGRLHADGYTADEVLNITFRKPSSGQGYVRTAVEMLRASAEATLRYYENSMGAPGGPAMRFPQSRINRVEQLAAHTPYAAHSQARGSEAPAPVSSHVPAHNAPILVHSAVPITPSSPMPAPSYAEQAQPTPQRRLQPVPQSPAGASDMPSDIHTLTGPRPSSHAPHEAPAQQQSTGHRHVSAAQTVTPVPFEIPTLAPLTGEIPSTHNHSAATAPAIAPTYAGPRGLSGAELAHELGRALHARVNIANIAPHQLTRDLSIKANTPHGTVTITGVSITADGQIVLQTY
ncbi:hypothetical protein [Jonesia quinghaiensis]|uniref:hypothetical protein n=1 Tax=Jonesia quinghaiensis TaxID=262806 RepID=UPI00040FEEEF|nr:hypothetical protein [Jonesia quinghaiensis]